MRQSWLQHRDAEAAVTFVVKYIVIIAQAIFSKKILALALAPALNEGGFLHDLVY